MGKVAAVGVLGALAFMGGRLGRKHLRRLPVKPQEVETCPVESVVDEPVPEPDKVLGVTGTAMVGGSLSILHRGEFVFWWQRAETSGVQDDGKELKFEDIPGADSDTYTCQLEDANTVLRVVYQRPGEAEVGFIYLNGKQPLTMDADTMQKVKSVPLAVFEVEVCGEGASESRHQLVLCPKFLLLKNPVKILCHEKYKTWPQYVQMSSHDQRAVFTIQRGTKPERIELQFQSPSERNQAVYLWHTYYSAYQAKAAAKPTGLMSSFRRVKNTPHPKTPPKAPALKTPAPKTPPPTSASCLHPTADSDSPVRQELFKAAEESAEVHVRVEMAA